MTTELEVFPEAWNRGLAVVAHPDDMEYGAASAVSRWTQMGKDLRYVLVTKGEAGISSVPPSKAGDIREQEQRNSCAAVGVTDVTFLDHRDGLVVADIALRHDLARVIRIHRPEVILSGNFRDSWGGPSWNHADHRAVGVALLDAVRDAANPWLFTDLADAGLEPWGGVEIVAFGGSPQPTHAVDISDHIEAGVASLRCHSVYLSNLNGDPNTDPTDFLRQHGASAGSSIGVELATTFEIIRP